MGRTDYLSPAVHRCWLWRLLRVQPFQTQAEPVDDYLGRFGLTAILLVVVLFVGKTPIWPLAGNSGFADHVARCLPGLGFAVYLLKHLGVNSNTPEGSVIQKVNEFVIIVSMVVSLTLLSRGGLGSISCRRAI